MAGPVKILTSRYQLAKDAGTPQKMAQKLLREVYTQDELESCGLLPTKNKRVQKEIANEEKYAALMSKSTLIIVSVACSIVFPLIGLVEDAYPGKPWIDIEMKRCLNRIFLDSAAKRRKLSKEKED